MLCPCLQQSWSNGSSLLSSSIFSRLDSWADAWYREHKLSLLWAVGERVLEIGPGTGANFGYYRPGTEVLAVEPNRYMYPYLIKRANEFGLKLKIIESGAEHLPLSDNSVSSVVGTLVLCSVSLPGQVIREVSRVLKPGGHFHFIEHVAGVGVTKSFQQVLRWPWQLTFAGCRLNRNTQDLLRNARQLETNLVQLELGPKWLPIRPHIIGKATKRR